MGDVGQRRLVLSRRGVLSLLAVGAATALSSCVGFSTPGSGSTPAPGGSEPAPDQPAPDQPAATAPPPSENAQATDALPPGQLKVAAVLTGSGETGDNFANPNGVAVDAQDNLYVADSAGHRIVKLDKAGKFVASWGVPGKSDESQKDGWLEAPVDITIGPGGNVYTLDRATGLIQVYGTDGKYKSRFGASGGGFYNPFGLAGNNGGVFVADTGTGRVVSFNANGEKVADLALRGSGDGASFEPTGVTAEPDGTVTIGDGSLSRVLRYAADGKFIDRFDVAAKGSIRIARFKDGAYVISDFARGRLIKVDKTGKPLGKYGGQGADQGQFNLPTGVAIDSTGAVYVADAQNNRVQKVLLDQA